MKLIIKGSADKIKRLEKELRLRFKRDGLEASIDVKNIEVESEEVEGSKVDKTDESKTEPIINKEPENTSKTSKKKKKGWLG